MSIKNDLKAVAGANAKSQTLENKSTQKVKSPDLRALAGVALRLTKSFTRTLQKVY